LQRDTLVAVCCSALECVARCTLGCVDPPSQHMAALIDLYQSVRPYTLIQTVFCHNITRVICIYTFAYIECIYTHHAEYGDDTLHILKNMTATPSPHDTYMNVCVYCTYPMCYSFIVLHVYTAFVCVFSCITLPSQHLHECVIHVHIRCAPFLQFCVYTKHMYVDLAASPSPPITCMHMCVKCTCQVCHAVTMLCMYTAYICIHSSINLCFQYVQGYVCLIYMYMSGVLYCYSVVEMHSVCMYIQLHRPPLPIPRSIHT